MKKLILLFILVLTSFSASAQRVEKDKLTQFLKDKKVTVTSTYVIVKDNKGTEIKTTKIRTGNYNYEIKRNGRVIETGRVEIKNGRRIKTITSNGKVFRGKL